MPDIERRAAHVKAKNWLPEKAPIAKIARPILDPAKPMMVTFDSPMRGTNNRVPRYAYTLKNIQRKHIKTTGKAAPIERP